MKVKRALHTLHRVEPRDTPEGVVSTEIEAQPEDASEKQIKCASAGGAAAAKGIGEAVRQVEELQATEKEQPDHALAERQEQAATAPTEIMVTAADNKQDDIQEALKEGTRQTEAADKKNVEKAAREQAEEAAKQKVKEVKQAEAAKKKQEAGAKKAKQAEEAAKKKTEEADKKKAEAAREKAKAAARKQAEAAKKVADFAKKQEADAEAAQKKVAEAAKKTEEADKKIAEAAAKQAEAVTKAAESAMQTEEAGAESAAKKAEETARKKAAEQKAKPEVEPLVGAATGQQAMPTLRVEAEAAKCTPPENAKCAKDLFRKALSGGAVPAKRDTEGTQLTSSGVTAELKSEGTPSASDSYLHEGTLPDSLFVTPKPVRGVKRCREKSSSVHNVRDVKPAKKPKLGKKVPGAYEVMVKADECYYVVQKKKDKIQAFQSKVTVRAVACTYRNDLHSKLGTRLQAAWREGTVEVYEAVSEYCDGNPAFAVVEVHPNSKWLEVALWKTSPCSFRGISSSEALKVLNSKLFAHLCSVSKKKTGHIRVGATVHKGHFFGDQWLYRLDSLVYDHSPFFSKRTCWWHPSSDREIGVWSPALASVRTASLLLKLPCKEVAVCQCDDISALQQAALEGMPRGGGLQLCALFKGEVVGVATGEHKDQQFVLHTVYVVLACRKQGLGRLLVACLLSHQEQDTVQCQCAGASGDGLAEFFESLGWVRREGVFAKVSTLLPHPPLHVMQKKASGLLGYKVTDGKKGKRKLEVIPHDAVTLEEAKRCTVERKAGKRKLDDITKEQPKVNKAQRKTKEKVKKEVKASKKKEKKVKTKAKAPKENKAKPAKCKAAGAKKVLKAANKPVPKKAPCKTVKGSPGELCAGLGTKLATMAQTQEASTPVDEIKDAQLVPCAAEFPFIHAGVQYLNTAKGRTEWDLHERSAAHIEGRCTEPAGCLDGALGEFAKVVDKMTGTLCKPDILLSVACCLLLNSASSPAALELSRRCKACVVMLAAQYHHFTLLTEVACRVPIPLTDCLLTCLAERSTDAYFQLASQLDEELTALGMPTVRDWVWAITTEIEE